MPVYVYECDECKLNFDRFNSISARHFHACPECGKPAGKILCQPGMGVDTTVRDLNGTPIYFPKDSIKHYDRILKRTFHSKKEKAEYMKEQGLVMDGSNEPNWKDERCGDMRNKSYRREMENLKEPVK